MPRLGAGCGAYTYNFEAVFARHVYVTEISRELRVIPRTYLVLKPLNRKGKTGLSTENRAVYLLLLYWYT